MPVAGSNVLTSPAFEVHLIGNDCARTFFTRGNAEIALHLRLETEGEGSKPLITLL